MSSYSYTDPQSHRVELRATTRPRGPYVSCEAENLARGGDTVTVLLPAVKARALADHLDRRDRYEFVDVVGNTLSVETADDWTRFTFVRDSRQDDEPAGTVPVVVLTGRLPEVARALRAEAEGAEREQHAAEDGAQYCRGAAIDHDETGVCHHGPAEQPMVQTGACAPLEEAAARFAAVFSLQDTACEVAAALPCTEIDALVGLLRAAGAPGTATACWLDAHAGSEPECRGHSAG
ncbi:hypothetical protein [Streptomyces sp. NPDC058145]|uniref:hypothetical protein n=1 Tax=Streptomyces sp. NPDC058145 TaxID=3346356 RepID=UPI0036E3957A